MILLWCSGSAGVAAVPNPLGGDAAWMRAIATRSAPTWANILIARSRNCGRRWLDHAPATPTSSGGEVSGLVGVVQIGRPDYLRMLTARAMTRAVVDSAMAL